MTKIDAWLIARIGIARVYQVWIGTAVALWVFFVIWLGGGWAEYLTYGTATVVGIAAAVVVPGYIRNR